MLKEYIGIVVKFLVIGFLFLILNIWITSLYIDATYMNDVDYLNMATNNHFLTISK